VILPQHYRQVTGGRHFAGEGQKPEHLARHPWGKVPVLEHDGFSLFETVAVTRYVDEGFPGRSLQPADAR
jgi:glutathione S-transferase